jgi:hypothetical protein
LYRVLSLFVHSGAHSLVSFYSHLTMMGHSSPSFLHLVAREVVGNATANTDGEDGKPTCGGGGVGSEIDFNMGLHIGALFIILTTSACGI